MLMTTHEKSVYTCVLAYISTRGCICIPVHACIYLYIKYMNVLFILNMLQKIHINRKFFAPDKFFRPPRPQNKFFLSWKWNQPPGLFFPPNTCFWVMSGSKKTQKNGGKLPCRRPVLIGSSYRFFSREVLTFFPVPPSLYFDQTLIHRAGHAHIFCIQYFFWWAVELLLWV